MAQRWHSVPKTKGIVTLKRKGLSHQQVADAPKVSKGSVNKVFPKFNASGNPMVRMRDTRRSAMEWVDLPSLTKNNQNRKI
jgi:hypothetical protein